jgi:hypothetical protein
MLLTALLKQKLLRQASAFLLICSKNQLIRSIPPTPSFFCKKMVFGLDYIYIIKVLAINQTDKFLGLTLIYKSLLLIVGQH